MSVHLTTKLNYVSNPRDRGEPSRFVTDDRLICDKNAKDDERLESACVFPSVQGASPKRHIYSAMQRAQGERNLGRNHCSSGVVDIGNSSSSERALTNPNVIRDFSSEDLGSRCINYGNYKLSRKLCSQANLRLAEDGIPSPARLHARCVTTGSVSARSAYFPSGDEMYRKRINTVPENNSLDVRPGSGAIQEDQLFPVEFILDAFPLPSDSEDSSTGSLSNGSGDDAAHGEVSASSCHMRALHRLKRKRSMCEAPPRGELAKRVKRLRHYITRRVEKSDKLYGQMEKEELTKRVPKDEFYEKSMAEAVQGIIDYLRTTLPAENDRNGEDLATRTNYEAIKRLRESARKHANVESRALLPVQSNYEDIVLILRDLAPITERSKLTASSSDEENLNRDWQPLSRELSWELSPSPSLQLSPTKSKPKVRKRQKRKTSGLIGSPSDLLEEESFEEGSMIEEEEKTTRTKGPHEVAEEESENVRGVGDTPYSMSPTGNHPVGSRDHRDAPERGVEGDLLSEDELKGSIADQLFIIPEGAESIYSISIGPEVTCDFYEMPAQSQSNDGNTSIERPRNVKEAGHQFVVVIKSGAEEHVGVTLDLNRTSDKVAIVRVASEFEYSGSGQGEKKLHVPLCRTGRTEVAVLNVLGNNKEVRDELSHICGELVKSKKKQPAKGKTSKKKPKGKAGVGGTKGCSSDPGSESKTKGDRDGNGNISSKNTDSSEIRNGKETGNPTGNAKRGDIEIDSTAGTGPKTFDAAGTSSDIGKKKTRGEGKGRGGIGATASSLGPGACLEEGESTISPGSPMSCPGTHGSPYPSHLSQESSMSPTESAKDNLSFGSSPSMGSPVIPRNAKSTAPCSPTGETRETDSSLSKGRLRGGAAGKSGAVDSSLSPTDATRWRIETGESLSNEQGKGKQVDGGKGATGVVGKKPGTPGVNQNKGGASRGGAGRGGKGTAGINSDSLIEDGFLHRDKDDRMQFLGQGKGSGKKGGTDNAGPSTGDDSSVDVTDSTTAPSGQSGTPREGGSNGRKSETGYVSDLTKGRTEEALRNGACRGSLASGGDASLGPDDRVLGKLPTGGISEALSKSSTDGHSGGRRGGDGKIRKYSGEGNEAVSGKTRHGESLSEIGIPSQLRQKIVSSNLGPELLPNKEARDWVSRRDGNRADEHSDSKIGHSRDKARFRGKGVDKSGKDEPLSHAASWELKNAMIYAFILSAEERAASVKHRPIGPPKKAETEGDRLLNRLTDVLIDTADDEQFETLLGLLNSLSAASAEGQRTAAKVTEKSLRVFTDKLLRALADSSGNDSSNGNELQHGGGFASYKLRMMMARSPELFDEVVEDVVSLVYERLGTFAKKCTDLSKLSPASLDSLSEKKPGKITGFPGSEREGKSLAIKGNYNSVFDLLDEIINGPSSELAAKTVLRAQKLRPGDATDHDVAVQEELAEIQRRRERIRRIVASWQDRLQSFARGDVSAGGFTDPSEAERYKVFMMVVCHIAPRLYERQRLDVEKLIAIMHRKVGDRGWYPCYSVDSVSVIEGTGTAVPFNKISREGSPVPNKFFSAQRRQQQLPTQEEHPVGGGMRGGRCLVKQGKLLPMSFSPNTEVIMTIKDVIRMYLSRAIPTICTIGSRERVILPSITKSISLVASTVQKTRKI